MPQPNRLSKFFGELGPGLITGAADDDPSGIATYSVTGAGFGYGPLWTALFSFPLMTAVQLMCARLGMVTGRGLAAVGAVGRVPAGDRGERGQHRRGSGRHGACDSAGHGGFAPILDARLRRR